MIYFLLKQFILSFIKFRSKTKELYIINNGYHEMYIDIERNEFFSKMYQWIIDTKHIGKTDRRMIYLIY